MVCKANVNMNTPSMTRSHEHWVFIVDDDQAMRASLQWLIEADGLAVRSFESADAFLSSDALSLTGCLLLDIRMPGMNGLELQAHLNQRAIGLPIIMITGHGDVAMAVKAMKAGAVDFIEKPFNAENLLGSIHQALHEDDHARAQRRHRQTINAHLATLTRREHEVMEQVIAGHSNREIAASLGVSTKTIEVHRARVMDKMQAGSLAELVRMALLAGAGKLH